MNPPPNPINPGQTLTPHLKFTLISSHLWQGSGSSLFLLSFLIISYSCISSHTRTVRLRFMTYLIMDGTFSGDKQLSLYITLNRAKNLYNSQQNCHRVNKKSLCTWRLYCNHQAHRDFLITLYISPNKKKEHALSRAKSSSGDALIGLQGSTSASWVLAFL